MLVSSLRTLDQSRSSRRRRRAGPTTAASWVSPEAVLRRAQWCEAFAERLPDPPDPVALAVAAFGDALPEETRAGDPPRARRAASASRCCSPARNFSAGDAMIARRDALRMLAGGGAIGAFAVLGLPGAVFAAAPGERRFVVVLLRGALDGLAAVPPLGERAYAEKRGALALKPPGEPGGALPLDAHFALHPGAGAIHPYCGKGELLFVHAAGNGYHTRSHFDAQDLMESGLAAKTGSSDGWLNRALGR